MTCPRKESFPIPASHLPPQNPRYSAYLPYIRGRPYAELAALVPEEVVEEVQGPSGATYNLDTQALWDDRKRGHLRVMVAIDDGGWRAFSPLTEDFIIAPDGTFVGE